MTKKKHRKNKAKNLENKNTYNEICNERPEWADDEKIETNNKNWLQNFIAEAKEAIKVRDQGISFA